jgi:acetyltransferase-like isoleucine patch superfamily enzyme
MFDNANLFKQRGGRKTSFVLWLARFFWNSLQGAKANIVRAGYTSRTMAEYFRKQGAQIGENCDIGIKELGTEPYLVTIGNHVFISQGVIINTHDGGAWIFRDKAPDIRVYGPVVIEDNCIIGVNSIIGPDVRIGRNSIVGASSVVISDVPPNSIFMGVPARAISSISKYEEKCLAKWEDQRPPDLKQTKDLEWWFYRENNQKLRRHLTNLFANQKKLAKDTTR